MLPGLRRILCVPYKEELRTTNVALVRFRSVSNNFEHVLRGYEFYRESPCWIRTIQTCLKLAKGWSDESTLSANFGEFEKLLHLALKKPYLP